MKFSYGLLLLLIPIAYSLDIGLSIEQTFFADIMYFSYNDTFPLKSFTTEILNSGSLPYIVQARVDISGNNSVFTAWSERKRLVPGNNAFFALYWLPQESGNYTARLRVYYGGEVREEYMNITANKAETADIFEISEYRVLDKYIDMKISGKELHDIVVIPVAPQGWVFSQKSGAARFLIPYSAPGLDKNDVKFIIASKEGGYASKKILSLERKTDLTASVYNLIFALLETI